MANEIIQFKCLINDRILEETKPKLLREMKREIKNGLKKNEEV